MSRTSNTFTEDEIGVAIEILAILSRGGDPRILARSKPARSLAKKFAGMKRRLEASRNSSGANTPEKAETA